VVRRGDDIYRLSRNYGVPASRIIEANRLTNPDSLVVGQALVIPGDISETTVRSGQSLYSIARDYGIGLDTLLRANPGITNPASLQIGQRVVIPAAAPKLGAILVNGYAFPSISRDVLAETLPYLTYLSPFSYQVRPDGSLKVIADTDLIQAARAANVAPMMVITNLEEGAGFSSELANTILTNEQLQNTLIGNIVSTLQEKNYFGLDVDFEYIYPEDRENYNQFMRRVVNVLRPLGYTVTVALAPKSSAGQSGLLYEAHDYAAMGAIVDHVILMTYEWGYTYGPAMAVSPINQVRRVLDYATSVIPSRKILMGMPN
jgi:spore germination protein